MNLLQRAEAVRTTRHVCGVRAVDDQLCTRPVGAAHRTDVETNAAVVDALILDDAVPAYGTDVEVEGGRVTFVGSRRSRVSARGRRADRRAGPRRLRGAPGVTVTVRDNVVTLSGSVRAGEDRGAAVAAAARTPGVAGVRDEVRVVA